MSKNRLQHIRLNVFGMTQSEFANLINVTQPTYSAFEKNDSLPFARQEAIRKVAAERGIPWDDTWFFETPENAA